MPYARSCDVFPTLINSPVCSFCYDHSDESERVTREGNGAIVDVAHPVSLLSRRSDHNVYSYSHRQCWCRPYWVPWCSRVDNLRGPSQRSTGGDGPEVINCGGAGITRRHVQVLARLLKNRKGGVRSHMQD